ncbi:hypothetical protein [Companilactobacillus sp.]|jgi:hypothetical protein|uniref:hypothetical protein n=1 Tax=Companilactobacillus sp. TaxID=2767905 RepID=UPI0025BD4EF5|nr:hypothetical protein [Companilactobacillus sp.]MCH4007904.1 hypothetical protein [Companilactobacillus sp.]MCH4051917.1 hypothetical protein [Companilactobacillus sp.]MCH4075847.1 hypothetical protein [Companilactobacillus sp.]MCH4124422.1 hypothetical protein [Companilactobacillus sp.]MCH4132615.1 hypothetical protein [Companilactobacillus sp.]
MSSSEYFEIQEVDSFGNDNRMDPYMAMDLEFTFGVMDTEENYETFRKQYDKLDDKRFKRMISDSVTVPMKSLGMDPWFDDYFLTVKDQMTLDNFKQNVDQVLNSPYDAPTKLVGEQLMVAIVEGLPSVGHDEFLQTKNAMAQSSADKVYRVYGVGTVGFNFSDYDIALQVAEAMYKKASVKLNDIVPEMKIESSMLLDYPLHIVTYDRNKDGDYEAITPIQKLVPKKDPSEIKDYK